MADRSEKILVESDYDNIILIDPNKVVDENQKVQERYIKQENLVMYANLECQVIPRTKLAIGAGIGSTIQTISIASINFLKPGGRTFLDNRYTDEITGKGSLQGLGDNQVYQTSIPSPTLQKPGKSDDYYIQQTLKSGGVDGPIDNGLLGITSITIKQNLSFMPVITIELEDVKGRALFEGGNSSPYAAFFNLPYPVFNLTIKGFYGKAIKLPIMLQSFTSRYDTSKGNFVINLIFYTYKYTVLSEISMAALAATPHMYPTKLKIETTKDTASQFKSVDNITAERGYQKIIEVYQAYKSKGLIPDDFPELTLVQLLYKLELFVKNVLDTFVKQNLEPLNNLSDYQTTLTEYQKKVFYEIAAGKGSWFDQYMDKDNFFVLNDKITRIYTYKTSIDNGEKRANAFSDLKNNLIKEYNAKLAANPTVGVDGGYTINGKKVSISIPNPITADIFIYSNLTVKDIDLQETYRQRKNLKEPTTLDELTLEKELQLSQITNTLSFTNNNGNKSLIYNYFQFEGEKRFIGLTNEMLKNLKGYKEQIETALTEALSTLLTDKNNGIGFVPNIRNILAIVFANGEGFLRLMDEVHTRAWDKRGDKNRKAAILNDTTKSASADALNDLDKTPVYPWPQFINHTNGLDGKEKFELAYPGDPDLINQTKGYLYDVWPEVEFVEQFISGLAQRDNPPHDPSPTFNELTEPQRITLDAIEFPISNQVFQNKQLVKYMYEIWERLFLVSNYSKLSRVQNSTIFTDKIASLIAEGENINISKSLSNNDVDIIQNLKNYGINATNFLGVLQHFSNEGVGPSWTNLTLGIFNTPYIKNITENGSFQFLDSSVLLKNESQPIVSLENENNIKDYVSNSSTSNYFDFTDLYPFTNLDWDKTYLANGKTLQKETDMFKTSDVLNFNSDNKIISNFLSNTTTDSIRPITNFVYKKVVEPITYTEDLLKFYEERSIDFKNQLPTEGNIRYYNYNGLVTSAQTTSILNTPYFINAIQIGVQNEKNLEKYPYVAAAYLFLNSLPLSTLREKYKTFENNAVKDLDYIASTLKKFGTVHKMPYPWILKMGSIWHRYKTFYETGTDILTTSWSGFNYSYNYDPINSDVTKKYKINTTDNDLIDIVLQENNMTGTTGSTYINTGFYPKLINDFSTFYLGYQVFDNYESLTVQSQIVSNGVNINNVDKAIINETDGTDINNPYRTISITPWWVTLDTLSKQFMYIVPSQGALINQTQNECFSNGYLIFEVTGNTAMYDGSIRLFWTSPNYGYFESEKLKKPAISEYMKYIFSGSSEQENFSINGEDIDYTTISEIFSVFEKSILDKFESEFLNFSKSAVDYDNSVSTISNVPDVILDKSGNLISNTSTQTFKNFQTLMRGLMIVPKVKSQDGTDFVNKIQNNQTINIQNILSSFLTYDVVFKYGNPSNFNKKLFYSFSDLRDTNPEPYTWSNYTTTTPNYLPTPTNGIDFITSVFDHPTEWFTLFEYVGFSEIPQLDYFGSGSYIIDFFLDINVAFTVGNIKTFAPIIKIYATQKLKDSTLDKNKFFNLMTQYLLSNAKFQSDITNNLFIRLQKSLPNVDTAVEKKILTELLGNQSKVELWESFKAINDKWISGLDLKDKTLFEDVLLVDRASRNIGEKILVDIYKLKDELLTINPKSSMLTFVQSILVENHFYVMNIPSYINFYNVQEVTKNPIPKFDGTAEFADTLFGTHLNVDYRKSSSKMVCFYGGKPSEQLAAQNIDIRYRDDSFDLRRPSDNPLVENLIGKKDWDKSNRVVGFNVDIGPQNQSIFNGFSVAQDAGLATAESLEIINQMANQSGNRKSSTQSVSLYNLYKNRSYKCTLTMLGNAMIQPTMYFNLRNVPMFSGPYMITQVDHSIKPGSFDTYIQGIRQPTASLPKIDDYIQSLKTNLLQTILDENKKETVVNTNKTTSKTDSTNVVGQKDAVVANATDQKSQSQNPTQDCLPASEYVTAKWVPVSTEFTTISTYKEVVQIIMSLLTDKKIGDDNKLKYAVFSAIYLASNATSNLVTQYNNYPGIQVNIGKYWGDSPYFNKKYYCGTNKVAYAVFNTPTDSISFLIDRWKGRTSSIPTNSKEDITKFWIINFGPKQAEPNVYTQMTGTTTLSNIENNVQQAINEMNKVLGVTTKESPKATNVAQPSPFDVKEENVTYTGPPGFVDGLIYLTVKIDTDFGLWNILSTETDCIITALCASNKKTLNLNEFISSNKQVFGFSVFEMLRYLNCNSDTGDKGIYNLNIKITAIPVLNDGNLDNTRTQQIQSIKVRFEIK